MSRSIIAGVIAAIGGAVTAWGIVSIIDSVGVGTCIGTFEACGPQPTHLAAVFLGPIIFIAAAFASHFAAWMTGPLAGLVTAGVLLSQEEGGLSSDDLGMGAFIAACVLAGPLLLLLMRGRARSRQKLAEHLMQTGRRGIARVQGAQQTGVYINERPQLRVSYMIQPLDGSPPFPHTKTQLLDYGGIQPQPGLAWPCWYDPADQSTVAVGTPSGADPQTMQLLAEFGIAPQQAFGYDPTGGITLPDPQALTRPPGS